MSGSQISSIGNVNVPQSSGLDIVKRQEEAAEVMFADMISMSVATNVEDVSADLAGDAASEIVPAEGTDTRKENVQDAYEKYQYKDKSIRAEEKAVSEEDAKKVVEELDEFSEGVTEVLSEELHVSKEEIEAAMEQLGLSYLDLLDASNLANLVAKLNGSENVSQLLLSEAFVNIVNQVNELGAEMLDELQMTVEELEMTILDNPESFEEILGQVQSNSQAMTAGEKENVIASDMAENALRNEEQPLEDGKENIILEDNRPKAEASEEMNMDSSDMSDENDAFLKENLGEQKLQNQDAKGNEQLSFNNTVQTNTIGGQTVVGEAVQNVPTYVNVSELMEQIVEQTRITLTTETSKMEMQLNPEHLGKLYLEVTESEGSITAKIQTQNAIVKEALEMQIADLRQNLNQAGVKVDAIEVTVASHEFEQNLEQNANSEKQQEDAQPKAARLRNLNLSDLDQLSGLMTEEEELVAKMMAEQGNSVDFTA